jgi:alginate O-acetyltransferase complex protein AlgI
LRDYVFIPLGGSRGTSWQTHRNLMITMILGGLWHGASWPFVIWGVLHGGLLVMHRMFRQWCERNARLTEALESPAGSAVRIALTLVVVSLGWVLFRAPTMTDACKVYHRLFVPLDGGGVTLPLVSVLVLIGIATAAHLLGESGIWRRWWKRMPSAALALGYASIALLAALLAPASGKAFIYFQF